MEPKIKVGNFPYLWGGKVGNLFMIFFQHLRVKFLLFFDAIQYIWDRGNRGTMVFKLNIFQRIFGDLRVILTSESTQ